MKTGEYIVDRLLPQFVRAAAERRGIECTSMSGDWVLRLEKGAMVRWVLGYQFDVNRSAASAVAQDKVATHLALAGAGVPSGEHVLVRSILNEPFPTARLQKQFPNSFVIKPLYGSGGRGIYKVDSVAEAERIIAGSSDPAWAASPFYDIQAEYRVIMLDGTVLVSFEKKNPHEQHGMRFFNLGMGAKPTDVVTQDTQAALEDIARHACSALGLRVASVDIMRTAEGLRIMEVNDGVMMERYARTSDQYKQNAALAYEAIVAAMFV